MQVGTAWIFHPSNCTPQQACAGTKTRKAEGDNTNAATAQSHVVPRKTVPELTRGHDTPANRFPLFSLSATLYPLVSTLPTSMFQVLSCRGLDTSGVLLPGEVLWEGNTDTTRTESEEALPGRQEQHALPPLPGWAHMAGRTGPGSCRRGPRPPPRVDRPDTSTECISSRTPTPGLSVPHVPCKHVDNKTKDLGCGRV